MEFSVSQNAFVGPFRVLLDALEKRELEITEVNLAAVAEDYLRYVNEHEVHPHSMADFLLISSKLIYLKSRQLLPYLEVEQPEEIDDLEDQLRLYKEFAQAAEHLAEVYHSLNTSFSRPVAGKIAREEERFSPPPNVTQESLRESFDEILKRLQPFFTLQQTSMERIQSIEERIAEMRDALQSRKQFSFHEVVRKGATKGEVVVSFLALLELVRQQLVKVEQKQDNTIAIERV